MVLMLKLFIFWSVTIFGKFLINMMLTIGAIIIVVVTFLYFKTVKPYQYWKKRNVSYVKPVPILGNMISVILKKKNIAEVLQDIYNKFPNQRYFGFYDFSNPVLIIRDVNLIKQICITDFDKFTDHEAFFPDTSEAFWNNNLFASKGEHWHKRRAILSPAFSSSKLKGMFHLITECAEKFVNHFSEHSGTITLEMKHTFSRLTNDVIASCAFGITCDSLNDENNEFLVMAKKTFNAAGINPLMFIGYIIHPIVLKLLNIQIVDNKTKHFFRSIVKETIEYREKVGLVRPDMIHLLRNAIPDSSTEQENRNSNKSIVDHALSVEDIAINAFSFFIAGYDTVSVALSNMAYELAINFEVQEKLIREIDETLKQCNGNITYEAIMAMKYLDMVLSETFRLWTASLLTRIVVKPFTIKATHAGERPLHLDVGTSVWIPNLAVQRDPNNFPNPMKFDPERFNTENKHNVKFGSYLSFGLGPRICIGSRFAVVEVKVIICLLLSKFNVVPVEKTDLPLIIKPDSINIESKNGYWLGLKPRNALQQEGTYSKD